MRPFVLPHYSSEPLNWIEDFWEQVKSLYFSRMLTQQREDFYPNAVRLLRSLQRPGRSAPLALPPNP